MNEFFQQHFSVIWASSLVVSFIFWLINYYLAETEKEKVDAFSNGGGLLLLLKGYVYSQSP